MNTNEQKNETNPAQLHQGVNRIERAFENLAARVAASNERLQRARAQQQRFQGFDTGKAASHAPQARQAQNEEAQMAEIHAWAAAHRDEAPVVEKSDPLEAHKKMWLDVADSEPAR